MAWLKPLPLGATMTAIAVLRCLRLAWIGVKLRPNSELENRAPSRLQLTRKLPEASRPRSASLPLDDLYHCSWRGQDCGQCDGMRGPACAAQSPSSASCRMGADRPDGPGRRRAPAQQPDLT